MFHDGFGAKGLHKEPQISPFLSNRKGVSTKCAGMVEKWGEKGLDVRSDVLGTGDKEGGEGKWVKQSISPRSKNVTRTAALVDMYAGEGLGPGATPHLRRGGNISDIKNTD